MAKPKINYEDVKNACEQILADDEEPTTRNVRAILGAGSMQTILSHIQEWNKTRAIKVIPAESIDKKLLQLINETVSHSVRIGIHKIQEELVKATTERDDISAEFKRLESDHNIAYAEIERYKIGEAIALERSNYLQERLTEAESNNISLTNKNEVLMRERDKFESDLIATLEQCQQLEHISTKFEKLKLDHANLAGQFAGINCMNFSQQQGRPSEFEYL